MERHFGGNMSTSDLDELRNIRRVSDMMVTAHTCIKERYSRRDFVMDIFLFLSTVFLCVFAFTDPVTLRTYIGTNAAYIIGICSIFTFFLSYCANKFEWKVKADRHQYAASKCFEIKKEADELIRKIEQGQSVSIDKLTEKNKYCTSEMIKIPEKLFIKCKKWHKMKIEMSQWLDEHPHSWLFLFKVKRWYRDNINNCP